MRKVFSSNEVSETVLIRDALVHQGLEATIQNEYSGGSAVPAFRPPAEVWVAHDRDYEDARRIVAATISTLDTKSDAKPWICSSCREENPESFEMCWKCGHDKGKASRAR
ncbi:MAG: DUF2007 domain-containing protein [Lysobacterales bacterium]|nr:MAG: DUF2007 domain-containing protein [Xanthomonadales bacterium]